MAASPYLNICGFESGDISGLRSTGWPFLDHIIDNNEARSGRFFLRHAKPVNPTFGGQAIMTLGAPAGLTITTPMATAGEAMDFGVSGYYRVKQDPSAICTLIAISLSGNIQYLKIGPGEILNTWQPFSLYVRVMTPNIDPRPCCNGVGSAYALITENGGAATEITLSGGPTWEIADWRLGSSEGVSAIVDFDDLVIWGGPAAPWKFSSTKATPECVGFDCRGLPPSGGNTAPLFDTIVPLYLLGSNAQDWYVKDLPVDTLTPVSALTLAAGEQTLFDVENASGRVENPPSPLDTAVGATITLAVTVNAKASVASDHTIKLDIPVLGVLLESTVTFPTAYGNVQAVPRAVFTLPNIDVGYLDGMRVGVENLGGATVTIGGGIVVEVARWGNALDPRTLPSEDDGSGHTAASCIQEYLGDGIPGRVLHFGFRPHVLIFKPHNALYGAVWHCYTGGTQAAPLAGTADRVTLLRQAVLGTWAGGCYLGVSNEVNQAGVLYTVIALRDTGDPDTTLAHDLRFFLGYGVYAGTGTTGHEPKNPLSPYWHADDVLIAGGNLGGMFARMDYDGLGAGSLVVRGDGQLGDPAAGDTVGEGIPFLLGSGTRVNINGGGSATEYFWIALRRLAYIEASLFSSGFYAPSGAGIARVLTSADWDFVPQLALVGGRGEPTKQGVWWKGPTLPPGVQSRQWGGSTVNALHVTALGPTDRVDVGAILDQTGAAGYLYWVFGGAYDGVECYGGGWTPPGSPPGPPITPAPIAPAFPGIPCAVPAPGVASEDPAIETVPPPGGAVYTS